MAASPRTLPLSMQNSKGYGLEILSYPFDKDSSEARSWDFCVRVYLAPSFFSIRNDGKRWTPEHVSIQNIGFGDRYYDELRANPSPKAAKMRELEGELLRRVEQGAWAEDVIGGASMMREVQDSMSSMGYLDPGEIRAAKTLFAERFKTAPLASAIDAKQEERRLSKLGRP